MLEAALRVHQGAFTLDASLRLPAGVTALVGPSGAGKSTLLGALAGLVEVAAGSVRVGETWWLDTTRGLAVPAHRRAVGVVFQRPALFPHLRVLDNVMYGISGLPAPLRRERALAELTAFGAAHLAERWPASLSGGESQRVALARALVRPAALFLLDEPLSALDEQARDELAAQARQRLALTGACALWITHDRDEARAVGRSLRLSAGRVVDA